MTAKKEFQKALDELYEEHLGTTTGPVVKALNAMNHELDMSRPRVVCVQNFYDQVWDGIPANGGFGVVPANQVSRKLKRVKVVKAKEGSDEG